MYCSKVRTGVRLETLDVEDDNDNDDSLTGSIEQLLEMILVNFRRSG